MSFKKNKTLSVSIKVMSSKLLMILAFLIPFFSLIAQDKMNEREMLESLQQETNKLKYTPNKGQVAGLNGKLRPDVLYTAEAGAMNVFLRKKGISYVINNAAEVESNIQKKLNIIEHSKEGFQGKLKSQVIEELRREAIITSHQVDMNFLNYNKKFQFTNEQESTDYLNFYHEHCPNGVLGVKQYSVVKYQDVYNGIDVIFYGNKNEFKYDFIIQPNVNPNLIQLQWEGSGNIVLNEKGSLLIETKLNQIKESIPVAYQIINNDTIYVKAEYKIYDKTLESGKQVSFLLGRYDINYPLIIDPWVTYYGGNANDNLQGVTTDYLGNVYSSGASYSSGAISFAGHQNVRGGNSDAILVKFNSSGNRIWATYYGGNTNDVGSSVTTDSLGSVYMVGETHNNGAISFLGHQNTFGGNADAYLVKFNSLGVRIWGTYYGGSSYENSYDVEVDNLGDIYISGSTSSTNAIAFNGHQNTLGGSIDGFLVKFSSNGTRLWGTYYGGNNDDFSGDVSIDINGNVYIGGITRSLNGISLGGHQNIYGGGFQDGFLVKFSSGGTRLWGTYYGGSDIDYSNNIATDNNGNVYLGGPTQSVNGISFLGYQNNKNGFSDAFLAKFDSLGNRIWATYIGGAGEEESPAIAVDKITNEVYLACKTSSRSYTTSSLCSYQTNFVDPGTIQPNGPHNLLLIKFFENGNPFCFSYFGSNIGIGPSLSVDDCYMYFTGSGTLNGGVFTTLGAHQELHGGGWDDGFIAKLNKSSCGSLYPSLSSFTLEPILENNSSCNSSCNGKAKVNIENLFCGTNVIVYSYRWSTGDSTINSLASKDSLTNLCQGNYWVEITIDTICGINKDTLYFNVIDTISYKANFNFDTVCIGDSTKFINTSINIDTSFSYFWNFGDSSNSNLKNVSHIYSDTGIYSVRLIISKNNGSCPDSIMKKVRVLYTPSVYLGIDTVLCNSTLILDAGNTGLNFLWQDSSINQTLTAVTSGDYSVSVSNEGCVSTDSINLTFMQLYIPNQFDTIKSSDCDYILMNYTDSLYLLYNNCLNNDLVSVSQNPASGSIVNINTTPVIPIVLIYSDSEGGSIQYSFNIEITCIREIIVPQFISPNGDGVNDYWVINNLDFYTGNHVKIFNRWGNIVFEKDNYNNDWNGKYQKNSIYNNSENFLPNGTYFYILDLGDDNLEKHRGYLQIIK